MNQKKINICLTFDVDEDYKNYELNKNNNAEFSWDGIAKGIPSIISTLEDYFGEKEIGSREKLNLIH